MPDTEQVLSRAGLIMVAVVYSTTVEIRQFVTLDSAEEYRDSVTDNSGDETAYVWDQDVDPDDNDDCQRITDAVNKHLVSELAVVDGLKVIIDTHVDARDAEIAELVHGMWLASNAAMVKTSGANALYVNNLHRQGRLLAYADTLAHLGYRIVAGKLAKS